MEDGEEYVWPNGMVLLEIVICRMRLLGEFELRSLTTKLYLFRVVTHDLRTVNLRCIRSVGGRALLLSRTKLARNQAMQRHCQVDQLLR